MTSRKNANFLPGVLLAALFMIILGACSDAPDEEAADESPIATETSAEQTPVPEPEIESDYPRVALETSMGRIVIELWEDRAPVTVENFLRYVDEGIYDGLTFHRVIEGFMIQGGGYDADLVERRTGYSPITNEASADLPNDRGTIAMARTNMVHSATKEFFINHVDNDNLNHRGTSPSEFGYAVFGRVIEGMDVVDEIAQVDTGDSLPHRNVPLEPILIQSAARL